MKTAEHYLLGFDARETCLSPGSGWDESRKQGYLYRLDVDKSLSVDNIVWESVFDLHPELRPAYAGFYMDLFEDLERLEKLLATAAPDLETYDLVALGLNLTTCDVEERTKFDDYLAGEPYDGQPASGSPTGAGERFSHRAQQANGDRRQLAVSRVRRVRPLVPDWFDEHGVPAAL